MASKDQKPDDDRLLAYVAGRLSAEEAAVIEAAAAEDAEIATDIALMQGMRTALRDHETDTAPGELGWKRLERAIDAATPAPAPAARRAPVWQVAAVAAVAAVVCWQFVAVPLLDRTGAGYGTASEDPAAGFTLTVAFVPEATEAQIRALLEDTGGRITDGPSALGLWQVGFDSAADRDASLETFSAAAGLVDHVQPD